MTQVAILMTHPAKGRGFDDPSRLSDDPPCKGEGVQPRGGRRQFPILIGECSAGPPSEVRRASELRRASLRGPPGFRAPPGFPGLPPSEADLGWAQPPKGEPHCRNHRHYAINVGSGCQPGPRPHPNERAPAHINLHTPDRTLALSENALNIVFWPRDGF